MKVFVTRMLRYGNVENHSYIIGVYTSKEHAKLAGSCEESWRGGKYEYVIEECELDSTVPQEIWEYHNGLYTED